MAYQPLPSPSTANGQILFTVPGTSGGTLSVRRKASGANPAGLSATAAVPATGGTTPPPAPTITSFTATAQ